MENIVLKKKLSTFKTPKGSLTKVSDEVLFDVLCAWEQWTGPSKNFYKSIDVTAPQMGTLIGKAKKLKREGHFPVELFTELKIASEEGIHSTNAINDKAPIEIRWEKGKVISFYKVDHLVDFLKKVA